MTMAADASGPRALSFITQLDPRPATSLRSVTP